MVRKINVSCTECIYLEACEGFNQVRDETPDLCIARCESTWPLIVQVEKLHKEASDAISY